MKRFTAIGRTSGVLLLVIAMLAATITFELYSAGATGAAVAEQNASGEDAMLTESVPQIIVPDSNDFAVVLQRPLFFPDRKLPPEPTPEPAATTPLQPLRLTLEGIAISGDSRVAVLRNSSNNRLLQLAEGMSHNGWLLESMSADTATFRRGAQVTELALASSGRNGQP